MSHLPSLKEWYLPHRVLAKSKYISVCKISRIVETQNWLFFFLKQKRCQLIVMACHSLNENPSMAPQYGVHPAYQACKVLRELSVARVPNFSSYHLCSWRSILKPSLPSTHSLRNPSARSSQDLCTDPASNLCPFSGQHSSLP